MSAVPQHLSSRELAALGVDGLPSTQRSINRLRERHGWEYVERNGRKLIALVSLPCRARFDIQKRFEQASRPSPAPTIRRAAGRPCGTDFFSVNPDVAIAISHMFNSGNRPTAAIILQRLRATGAELPKIATLRRYIANHYPLANPRLNSLQMAALIELRAAHALLKKQLNRVDVVIADLLK